MNWAQIGKAAFHTFWQTFVALMVAWWVAAGASGFHQIHGVPDAKRYTMTALVAVGAAALSALYHSLREYAWPALQLAAKQRGKHDSLLAINQLLDDVLAAQAVPITATQARAARPHPQPEAELPGNHAG